MNQRMAYIAIVAIFVGGAASCDGDFGCGEEESSRAVEESSVAKTVDAADSEFDVPFPRNEWECTDENIERILEWPARKGDALYDPRRGPDVPEIDGPAAEVHPAVMVDISPERLSIQLGGSVGNPYRFVERPDWYYSALKDALDDRWQRVEDFGDDSSGDLDHPLIGLAVDPDITGDVLIEILDHLSKAADEIIDEPVELMAKFESDPPEYLELPPPPLQERVDDWARAAQTASEETDDLLASGNTWRQKRDQAKREATESCPEIMERWKDADLPGASPDERGAIVRDIYTRGLEDCDCEADVELFVTAMAASRNSFFSTVVPVVYEGGQWRLKVARDEFIPIEKGSNWAQMAPDEVEDVLSGW